MENVVYQWDIGDKRGRKHFVLMRNASLVQFPFREMTGGLQISGSFASPSGVTEHIM
jgi:hypothetical protein